MYGKILIQCELEVLTGMHIGGSAAFAAIGAVDSPVIRDVRTNDPMLPGSSLKGKLRTLLARSLCGDIRKLRPCTEDDPVVLRLFGSSAPRIVHSRLQFSDAFASNKEELNQVHLTEVKAENTIDRRTSRANPRQIERVVSGTKFAVQVIYDVLDESQLQEDFEYLARAMKLLQFDYLGGHGTRGYGRVRFNQIRLAPLVCDLPEDTTRSLENLLKKEVEQCELFRL